MLPALRRVVWTQVLGHWRGGPVWRRVRSAMTTTTTTTTTAAAAAAAAVAAAATTTTTMRRGRRTRLLGKYPSPLSPYGEVGRSMVGMGVGMGSIRWSTTATIETLSSPLTLDDMPGVGGRGYLPHDVQDGDQLRVLFVVKRHDAGTAAFAASVIDWLHSSASPPVQCFIEPTAAGPTGEPVLVRRAPSVATLGRRGWQTNIDLVVVCGGDGTLLHAQTLFQGPAPPLAAFSCGSLGFLMPFKPPEARVVLEAILSGSLGVLRRSRLEYAIEHVLDVGDGEAPVSTQVAPAMQILNEVVIKRPHDFLGGVTEIACGIDGNELARFQGDGLIVATPTGSTAYSMATGGSIVHPSIDCILVSPLCSMTLSSRPIILPGSATVTLSPLKSAAFLEGRWGQRLEPRDVVVITRSPYPLYTYLRSGITNNWVADLSENLMYERQVRVHARYSPTDPAVFASQFETPPRTRKVTASLSPPAVKPES
ncbi:uncharacterized protein AMSG_00576 [Thecamonas trahens ATCC 50062]|uniref:Uncharacterized protein n=1 Tax=Thecamonas trahens ATCC 50062 TaxID=461836 RepID=A0A0L0D9N9_THETB|nr:hypothetical protein AMSG_00576 [Thecamonas trahens ATCC 50062]KNC48796.1 hypothetical protein AMSG_00576 [Thecamonas trahens ATCC 50062]|eukprot:XP_013762847.1 hypothetical protein AMSG_00576 [Thecamonas trahens ATCC 50062]